MTAAKSASRSWRKLRKRMGSSSPRGELRHWRSWIETRGGDWPGAFERALDPTAPLDEPLIEERIGEMSADPVEILDVGAGPMTALGKVHPSKRLQITAVDPLAAQYDRLLERAGVTPPVRTVAGAGEELVALWGKERFDVVYARNAIDHSVDAPSVVEQMLDVLRPGGIVAMRHYRNEAELEGYWGMHRWNCDIEGSDFILWGDGRRVNITEQFAEQAQVECWLQETHHHAALVLCVMTKVGSSR
jgi:SAM-dependent methyltransferase